MPTRKPSARTRILAAADRLFSEHGIRTVGVEAIVAAADTAKTTLYSHFASKDALVVAYLERRAAQGRERLVLGLAAHRGSDIERLLHVFDMLADELAAPGYGGAPFLTARVELGDDHPAAVVAQAHRRWMRETFARLAAEAHATEPDAAAALLLQLYEAAVVAAQIDGDVGAVGAARAAAAALLATRLPVGAVEEAPRPAPPAGAITPIGARHRLDGSAEAHRLVAFLNTAHLPDGDDQLADHRAGPWLTTWLTDAHAGEGSAVPSGVAAITEVPVELTHLREGLRQLAVVNCGGQADPQLVAKAAAILAEAPLVLDLAGGAAPRLAVDTAGAGAAEAAARLVIADVAHAYLAVRARGEWPRLTVCASPDCRWAFFDTTRNHSRRWCDMAGCGNRAKNRAWRERHDSVTS